MLATKEQIQKMEQLEKEFRVTKFEIKSDVIKGIKKIIKGHKKAVVPVLNHVLVEVLNDKVICVKYTNMDLTIEKCFTANVENIVKKSFILPIDFIKSIKYVKKNEVFAFELSEDNTLLFQRDKVKQYIQLFDVSEYPKLDYLSEDEYRQVQTSNGYEYFEYHDLNVLVNATKSVAKTDVRPVLQELHIKDGEVVSTDSHRMFKAKTPFKLEEEFLINPILVNKVLDVAEKDMYLKMAVSDYRVKIHDDHSMRVYYNRADLNYPQTDRLLPSEFNYEFNLDAMTELVDYLKNTKKDSVIKMELDVNTSEATFKVEEEMFNTNITLPVTVNKNDTDAFKISYSATYLKEALEQLGNEPVTMRFVSNLRPFTITKQDSDKQLALVLPIRTY